MDLHVATGRLVPALLSVSVLASGCVGSARRPTSAPGAIWSLYFAAVEDARTPEPSEISSDLLALLPGSGKLRWKDGRVLMTTWTKSVHFTDPVYRKGHVFPLYGDTWFTAVPAVRDFCASYSGGDLDLRLRQLLGLPPDDANDIFLEVWIRPRDLFRPCPDPEITDSQCQVRIPLLDHRPPEPSEVVPPWYCPEVGAAPVQQQGQFVVVSQSHLRWMCDNWIDSYVNEDPRRDYPWTALGYTYDWAEADDHVGESEFVGVARAPVVFERLVPTDVYCGR